MKTRSAFVRDVRGRASVESEAGKHAIAAISAIVLAGVAVAFSLMLISATPGWDQDRWYEIVGTLVCWIISAVWWVVGVAQATLAFTSRKARR